MSPSSIWSLLMTASLLPSLSTAPSSSSPRSLLCFLSLPCSRRTAALIWSELRNKKYFKI